MSTHYTLKSIIIPLNRNKVTYISPKDADLWRGRWYAQIAPTYARRSFIVTRHLPTVNGKRPTQTLHRLILSRMLGRELTCKEEVDHRDCNPLNNRRSNLRLATKSQNMMNRGRFSSNTSGFKGVTKRATGKWRARIQVNGLREHIGDFDTPEEAYAAYCEAAKEKHGKYARLK